MGTNPMHLDGKSIADAIDKATAEAAPAASTTTAGVVKQAAAQANTAAADVAGLVTDFNALLAKLRTAGILHS